MPLSFDYEGDPFTAHDADGQTYLLTPLYRFRVAADGSRLTTASPNDCVGFRTDAGQWVAKDGNRRYLILDTDPATILMSDAPNAI